MYTVTFAGVEITAFWDEGGWYLPHVPRAFRARVSALLDAERKLQSRLYDGHY